MSLPVFDPQTHLFGLQAVSSEVFSEGDRYRLFAQKIYPLLVAARPKLYIRSYVIANSKIAPLSNRAQLAEGFVAVVPLPKLRLYRLDHFVEMTKVLIMNAQLARQLPDPFNRIKIGAVRRQVLQMKPLIVSLAPLPMQLGMMIAGVVENQNHAFAGALTALEQLLQKLPIGLPVKLPTLLRISEFPILKPHSAEIAHTFARGMMRQDRVVVFRRNSHAAPRARLLEVHFVDGPQIKHQVACPLVNFFSRACTSGSARASTGRGLR